MAAAFTIAAVVPVWRAEPPIWWALAVAGGFVGVAAAVPRALAPLNRAWALVGDVMHRVISPITLAMIFFGVLTPMALLLRLSRRDSLRLNSTFIKGTYWVSRTPPGPDPKFMKNQF